MQKLIISFTLLKKDNIQEVINIFLEFINENVKCTYVDTLQNQTEDGRGQTLCVIECENEDVHKIAQSFLCVMYSRYGESLQSLIDVFGNDIHIGNKSDEITDIMYLQEKSDITSMRLDAANSKLYMIDGLLREFILRLHGVEKGLDNHKTAIEKTDKVVAKMDYTMGFGGVEYLDNNMKTLKEHLTQVKSPLTEDIILIEQPTKH